MRNGLNRLYAFILILVLLAFLSACAGPQVWPSRKGQVLEWETKRPIEGVVVVATWNGYSTTMVDSQSRCYHVESAITDKYGRYRIPLYAEGASMIYDRYISYTTYKEGYKGSIDNRGYYRQEKETGLFYMDKDSSSREERLGFLLKILDITRCPSAGVSERNYYDLYNALYEEAISKAVTDKDRRFAIGFKDRATRIRQSNVEQHDEMYKPK